MSGPVTIADAGGRLQVVGSVLGAAGQALVDLLVHRAAVLALPACLAVALAVDAGAVARAGGIQAVGCTRVAGDTERKIVLVPVAHKQNYYSRLTTGWRGWTRECGER